VITGVFARIEPITSNVKMCSVGIELSTRGITSSTGRRRKWREVLERAFGPSWNSSTDKTKCSHLNSDELIDAARATGEQWTHENIPLKSECQRIDGPRLGAGCYVFVICCGQ
jgi:hypothetical protein